MIDTLLVVLIVGSTAILGAAEFVVRLLCRSSAATRFSIRQIAVCSLLLLPIGVLLLPEVPLGFTGSGSSNRVASTRSSTLDGDQQRQEFNFPSLDRPVTFASPQTSPTPGEQLLELEKTVSSTEPMIAAFPSDPAVPREFRFSVSMIVVTIWLVIALAFLTRTLLAHFRAEFAADPKANPVVPDCNPWLPAWVGLASSPRHAIPVTIGIWRRRIVLPPAAEKWPADQLRMVLKHELAHVVRRDVLSQLITSIATSLFWFQPLVWRADRQLRLERERACDDQVLSSGEVAEEYATVLVRLAAIFSGRTTISAGAISMAKKPIEQRLTTILSPSTSRASTSRWLGTLTTAIALLLVAGVCSIRPFAPVAVATASAPAAEPVQSDEEDSQAAALHFPSSLTGLVVDENGQPVAGAEVKLTATPRAMSELGRVGNTRNTVDLPVVSSDDSGKFTVNIAKLSTDKDIWTIQGSVNAKNLPPVSIYRHVRKGSKSSLALRTLRFQPGKTIVGRVVPPDGSEDKPLINPVVTVRSAMAGQWRGATVDCENDGRFSAIVPTDVAVSIQATADNFAGTGFEVLPQARELKDIPLLEGTTVKGKVLDRHGCPVVGVYVVSETDAPYTLSPNRSSVGALRFYRRCKTDANGEYKLKPQTGKIRVSLSSQIFNARSKKLSTSERVPPVVMPLLVDLAGAGLFRSINLTEAKTVQASGTIRWPDGSPAVGLDVDVQLMVGSYSTSVLRTKTAENGKYVASIPENNQSFISVSGVYVSAKQWLDAVPETTSDKATKKSRQSLTLAPLAEDVKGLDWKLSKQEQSTYRPQAPGVRELEELFTAQHDDRTKGDFRIAGAANEEEKIRLTERFTKQNKAHAARLVAFESEHRGEFAGAVALASYIDLGLPEQLEAFTDNYLDSANADVVIVDVEEHRGNIGNLAETRKFLRTFSDASPHPSIQAASLSKEAELIAIRIHAKELYKQPEWLPPIPKEASKEAREFYKQIYAEMQSVDGAQLLADYDAILQKLKTNYSKHGNTIGDGRRLDSPSDTYANQLQEMRFSLANLRSGEPLPRLTGSDVQGADFDSERLKGKAVLLFFASKFSTEWTDFNKLKELRKRYAGRPFEIVSVMVDAKLDDAKAVVDAGTITWPTLYDVDQQLMKKWQLAEGSEALLIDHRGIIHRRTYRDSSGLGIGVDESIEKLVKNAESK